MWTKKSLDCERSRNGAEGNRATMNLIRRANLDVGAMTKGKSLLIRKGIHQENSPSIQDSLNRRMKNLVRRIPVRLGDGDEMNKNDMTDQIRKAG